MEFNRDVLLMISRNFQGDRTSLYSCLLVNKSWCEAIVPILWKIPGQAILTEKAENIIFNVILSHFSEESRDILMKQGIDLFTEIYQAPSFNYIYFWRHLDLQLFDNIIASNLNESDRSIMKNELLKLFVNNNNTNFISLSVPFDYKCQINLLSWNNQCFSNLKFFSCCNDIDQNILKGLSTVSKSIKIFNCDICDHWETSAHWDISEIIRLIENQRNLDSIRIGGCKKYETWKAIEEVLIKKADAVKNLCLSYNSHNWNSEKNFLSHFVNLKCLEINELFRCHSDSTMPNFQLEKIFLPSLKILKATHAPIMLLVRFFGNTNVQLTVINIHFDDIFYEVDDVKRLVQAIYQNCPNLKYLNLPIKDYVFIEFERLLINCQHLIGLVIVSERGLQYKNLFEILTKSSPSSLIKFRFTFNRRYGPKYKLLRSFLANWKNRHTMLLQVKPVNFCSDQQQEIKRLYELIEYYETKGIVKKVNWDNESEDSIWIKKGYSY